MANDLTGNPWVLDTASATKLWSGPTYVVGMEWHPAAMDDDLEVQDALGNTKWKIRAASPATDDLSTGLEVWSLSETKAPWDGFLLKTIDSGTLYVYVA